MAIRKNYKLFYERINICIRKEIIMSEGINETLTEKEALEAVGAFANMCYDRGVRDTLIGVGVGVVVSTIVVLGVEAIVIRHEE